PAVPSNAPASPAAGKPPERAVAPLSAVVDEIVQGFEPECRLSRLRFSVIHEGRTSTEGDSGLVGLALPGAIGVLSSFLEEVAEPHVLVTTAGIGANGFALEI